ncbi:hypothetical protein GGR52DRAFT_53700 [Hypoxylon sp. FL1284]|nr:hypothetical protein GGR52DRAFT_53700 [Hypoxylon sp. FL1284]
MPAPLFDRLLSTCLLHIVRSINHQQLGTLLKILDCRGNLTEDACICFLVCEITPYHPGLVGLCHEWLESNSPFCIKLSRLNKEIPSRPPRGHKFSWFLADSSLPRQQQDFVSAATGKSLLYNPRWIMSSK